MIYKVLAIFLIFTKIQTQAPLLVPSIGEASNLINLSYKQLFEEIKKQNNNASLFLIKYERAEDKNLNGKMIFVIGGEDQNKYLGLEFSLLDRSKNNLLKNYVYSENLKKIASFLDMELGDLNISSNSYNYSNDFLNSSIFGKSCNNSNSQNNIKSSNANNNLIIRSGTGRSQSSNGNLPNNSNRNRNIIVRSNNNPNNVRFVTSGNNNNFVTSRNPNNITSRNPNVNRNSSNPNTFIIRNRGSPQNLSVTPNVLGPNFNRNNNNPNFNRNNNNNPNFNRNNNSNPNFNRNNNNNPNFNRNNTIVINRNPNLNRNNNNPNFNRNNNNPNFNRNQQIPTRRLNGGDQITPNFQKSRIRMVSNPRNEILQIPDKMKNLNEIKYSDKIDCDSLRFPTNPSSSFYKSLIDEDRLQTIYTDEESKRRKLINEQYLECYFKRFNITRPKDEDNSPKDIDNKNLKNILENLNNDKNDPNTDIDNLGNLDNRSNIDIRGPVIDNDRDTSSTTKITNIIVRPGGNNNNSNSSSTNTDTSNSSSTSTSSETNKGSSSSNNNQSGNNDDGNSSSTSTDGSSNSSSNTNTSGNNSSSTVITKEEVVIGGGGVGNQESNSGTIDLGEFDLSNFDVLLNLIESSPDAIRNLDARNVDSRTNAVKSPLSNIDLDNIAEAEVTNGSTVTTIERNTSNTSSSNNSSSNTSNNQSSFSNNSNSGNSGNFSNSGNNGNFSNNSNSGNFDGNFNDGLGSFGGVGDNEINIRRTFTTTDGSGNNIETISESGTNILNNNRIADAVNTIANELN